jgi:hypothetical protein
VNDALSSGVFAVSVASVMRPYQLKVLVKIVDNIGPDKAVTGKAVA